MTSTIGVKKIQYPNGTDILTLDSSGTLAIGGSITSNITTTGTVNTPSINGGQIGGRRNLVLNGAMQVSQSSTSATGVGGNISYHSLDRFLIEAGHTAGRLTFAQVADVHDGFSYATKLTCTTADTSIGADEYTIFSTRFEGQDLQHLKKGTSDAEKVTVSFYVKGNASATYTVELRDNDNGRFNSQEFPVTTDWVKITRTFTGDTTGSIDNDNALSLKLNFWLHAGSAYTGGTHVSNTWGTTSNQRVGDNQTSFFDSTDRTFFITGIQLEVGEQATAFEHKSFGEELKLCSRYFQKYTAEAQEWIYNEGNGAALKWWQIIFPNGTMRTSPSMSFSSGWTGGSATGLGGTVSSMSCTTSPNRASCRVTFSSAGGSAYNVHHCDSFDGDECFMDAEL